MAEAVGSTTFRQPLWGRVSKITVPTSCFTGEVHRLPYAPEAYGSMITRAKAAPAQSRSVSCSAVRESRVWL